MAAVRNHHGLKIAALLSAAFVFCAQPSFAAPVIAERLFLAKSSDSFWPWMIIALVVGGILTLISNYFEQERTKKIEELARSNGFTFRHTPTAADNDLPIGCYLAETGRDPAVSNVLEVSRTDELNFVLFEYEYTVGYGKSQHTTHQTIAPNAIALAKAAVVPSLSRNDLFQDRSNVRANRRELPRLPGVQRSIHSSRAGRGRAPGDFQPGAAQRPWNRSSISPSKGRTTSCLFFAPSAG